MKLEGEAARLLCYQQPEPVHQQGATLRAAPKQRAGLPESQ